MKTVVDRFWTRVAKQESGCWLWTGGKARGGYGKFRFANRTGLAHRFSYEQFIGPIPSGMQLDHLCRNRACCNPTHLEPVTGRENLLRGDTFQARNAAKTRCPAGHEYTPNNTYRYPDGRRRCIACRRASDNRDGPRERRKQYKRRIRAEARSA